MKPSPAVRDAAPRPLRVRTLAVRLTFWMFVSTALVVMIGNVLVIRANLQRTEGELALQLSEIVGTFETTFLQPLGSLQALSAGVALPLEGPECAAALRRLLAELPQVNVIALIDANGQLTCSSEGFENLPSVVDRAWFQDLMAGDQLVIGEYQVSRSTSEPNVILGTTLEGSPAPRFVGLGIRLTELSERLASGTILGGSAFVVDPSGTVLAHWPARAERIGSPADAALLRAVRGAEPSQTIRAVGTDGTSWLYAGREVEFANGRFVLATGAPLRAVWAQTLIPAATQGVALLVAVVIMFTLLHRALRLHFVGPLERASRFATLLTVRHDAQRLDPPARIAEVQEVYFALNALSAEISERLADLDFVNHIGKSGTWRMDLQGHEVKLSGGAASVLFGDAKLVAMPIDLDVFLSSVHPENVADLRTKIEWAASGEAELDASARLRRPLVGDLERHVAFVGEVRGGTELVGAVVDISNQVRVARLNERAARFAAIEGMAAGLSHDFNNRLTVVRANAEILGMQAKTAADASTAELILNASEQLARIMNRILNRVGQRVHEPRDVDLSDALREVVAETEASSGVSIDVDVDGARTAHVDPVWFTDAVAELLTNSIQATASRGKPVIVVEIYGAHLGPAYLATHPEASAGSYHVVSVGDNGVGIAPEDQGRVFDPLYSTKPGGSSYGLGLSNAYAFVRRAGGHMGLYSEVGVGTTMRMYVPARVVHVGAKPNADVDLVRPAPGSVPVLLLEDDEDVSAALEVHMRSQGFDVHVVNDAEDARRVIDRYDVQAAIIDAVIGGEVAGPAVIEYVRERRPGAAIVAMSGHHPRILGGYGSRADAFVRKPTTAREVTSVLMALLADGTKPRANGDGSGA